MKKLKLGVVVDVLLQEETLNPYATYENGLTKYIYESSGWRTKLQLKFMYE